MRIRRIAGLVFIGALGLGATAIGTGMVAVQATKGASMHPTYRAGDLAVLAKTGNYRLGDVVAYHHGDGAAETVTVLHRIVGGDATGFVLQGDNNESTDLARPAAGQIIGSEVLRIPMIGGILRSSVARVLLVLLMAALLGALMTSPRKPRPVAATPVTSRRPVLWRSLAVLDVILLAGVILNVSLWSSTPAPQPPARTQTGLMTYRADVPVSNTYPTGEVETGDAVFTQLLRTLVVSYSYDTTAESASVAGSGRVDAILSAATGWSTSLPVVPVTSLEGGVLAVTGSVDLAHIQRLAASVAEETGVDTSVLDVAVTAVTSVSVDGGEPVAHQTRLVFQLTPLVMTLTGAAPTDLPQGPAVTSTGPLPSVAPPQPSSDPIQWLGRVLLITLLLSAAGTVAMWPAPPGVRRDGPARASATV